MWRGTFLLMQPRLNKNESKKKKESDSPNKKLEFCIKRRMKPWSAQLRLETQIAIAVILSGAKELFKLREWEEEAPHWAPEKQPLDLGFSSPFRFRSRHLRMLSHANRGQLGDHWERNSAGRPPDNSQPGWERTKPGSFSSSTWSLWKAEALLVSAASSVTYDSIVRSKLRLRSKLSRMHS